jgi:hypothetical protein
LFATKHREYREKEKHTVTIMKDTVLAMSLRKDSAVDGGGQNTLTLEALLQQSDLDAGSD